MAGAMRKMAVYLGLVENEGQYDEFEAVDRPDDYDRDYDDRTRALRAVRDDEPVTRGASSAAAATRTSGASTAAASRESGAVSRITTLHPRAYNDARAIGEQFRDGTPVIMNLSEMDDGDAKRIVDFSAGLVFGLRGTIERVTQKVFLLSPANVTVTAEERERITQGGFFNQS